MRSYIIIKKKLSPFTSLPPINQPTHENIILDQVFTWFQISKCWEKFQINIHESATQSNRCIRAFTVWKWHALLINQNSLCYKLILYILDTTRFKLYFFPLVSKCHKDRSSVIWNGKVFWVCLFPLSTLLYGIIYTHLHIITYFSQLPKMYR